MKVLKGIYTLLLYTFQIIGIVYICAVAIPNHFNFGGIWLATLILAAFVIIKVIAENYTESFYLRLVSHSDSESSIILIFDSIEETLYYRNEFIEKSEEFKVEVYRDWVRWYTENNNYPWLVSGKAR